MGPVKDCNAGLGLGDLIFTTGLICGEMTMGVVALAKGASKSSIRVAFIFLPPA